MPKLGRSKEDKLFSNTQWKKDKLGNAVLELYIRDYDTWKNQNKAQAARKWIEELKCRPKFRDVSLKPRMVVAFIRSQEKSFEKAIKRGRELGIPPPEPASSLDPIRLELEIEFVTGLRTSKQPKSEIDRLCHYFNQLYDTLAPLHSFEDRNSCEPSYSSDVEDKASASYASPTNSSCTIRPASPDEFQFSSGTYFLRLVSETPSLPNIASQVSQDRFPGISGADSISTSTNDNENWHNIQYNPTEGKLFTFHTPTFGRAPIPIPIPSERVTVVFRNPQATLTGLSGRFEGLSLRNSNLKSISCSSLQLAPLPSLPCTDSETNPRKRKYGAAFINRPGLALPYDTARDSLQRAAIAHNRAMMTELKSAIALSRDDTPVIARSRLTSSPSSFSGVPSAEDRALEHSIHEFPSVAVSSGVSNIVIDRKLEPQTSRGTSPVFQCSFHTPQRSGTPIPVPVAVGSLKQGIEPKLPTPRELSQGFRGLHIMDVDSRASRESSKSTMTASTQGTGSRNVRVDIPPTEKSTEAVTTLRQLQDDAKDVRQGDRRAQKDARLRDLKCAMKKAKEDIHLYRAKSLLPNRRRIRATLEVGGASSEGRMTELQALVLDIQRERAGLTLQADRRVAGPSYDSLLKTLTDVRDSLIYNFRIGTQSANRLEEMLLMKYEIEETLQRIENTSSVSFPTISRLYHMAKQTVHICRLRIGLLVRHPSAKISRPYRQRRHRPDKESPGRILRQWFWSNSANPYPTKKQKTELSKETGLSFTSVNHWFRNARSRGIKDDAVDKVAIELLPLLLWENPDFEETSATSDDTPDMYPRTFEGQKQPPTGWTYSQLLENEYD